MKFETFNKVIQKLDQQSQIIDKLYDMNVDLHELMHPYHSIIGDMIEEEYGELNYEMWSWFVYDRDYGRRTDLTAHDADGNQICQDVKALWEYMEKYK